MTFEGQYLTYAEYQELGGSAIGETSFNLLEFEARRRIDIRTQNRLKDSEIPQEVKLCMYTLINSINNYNETMNEVSSKSNIASESTDGYSISYVNSTQANDIENAKNKEIEDIIRTYLLEVIHNDEHLMFVGVK